MFLISLSRAVRRADELQMAHDPATGHRDEYLPGFEIRVELRRGILGHREQCAQLAAQDRRGARRRTMCAISRPAHSDQGTIPELGTGRLVEHREVLEQVPVGIAEVHGGGRHPADDARLGRLGREERERRDAAASAGGRTRARTSSSDAVKATCSDRPIGAEPSDQRPSIASPGSPIQKNAAPRSGSSSASGRPTTSR